MMFCNPVDNRHLICISTMFYSWCRQDCRASQEFKKRIIISLGKLSKWIILPLSCAWKNKIALKNSRIESLIFYAPVYSMNRTLDAYYTEVFSFSRGCFGLFPLLGSFSRPKAGLCVLQRVKDLPDPQRIFVLHFWIFVLLVRHHESHFVQLDVTQVQACL